MKLGIVILNWNDAEGTGACLARLAGWSSLNPMLIVVDNASSDGSAATITAAFPGVELVQSDVNRGFAGGNNVGVERAMALGCEAIMLLNSDAVVEEDVAVSLVGCLDRLGGDAIVGPAILESTPAGSQMTYGGRDIGRYSRTRITHLSPLGGQYDETVRQVDYVPGTVLLTSASVFERVGLLHAPYFFSGEIADLCALARARGVPSLIDVSLQAQHGHDSDQPLRNTLYLYYSVRNRFLYIARHGGRACMALAFLWVGGAFAMMGLAVIRGDWGRVRAVALGLMHGVRGRWGDQNARFGV